MQLLKNTFNSAYFRLLCMLLLGAAMACAQDPGAGIGNAITTIFTGPLAVGLSIVALVAGGCMLAFGGPGAMRVLGMCLVGVALIISAPRIVAYIESIPL